jgi:predicted RNA-binding Zn-ribbon protein involved in translation (DUF1610 family)
VIVTCPSCQKRYRLEEKHFRGGERFRFTCPNCGQAIEAVREVDSPQASGGAPASEVQQPSTEKVHKLENTWAGSEVPESELLAMPEGKRVSLAVLQGNDAGTIIPVDKPVMLIGRAGADVNLNDSEVSRRHAQIEIKGKTILLRDLRSTNGTYINEQRITVTQVDHQCEFRVGTSTLMLIVTDEQP